MEKTIAYAPAEVCAYRYLSECHLEAGHPETAAQWYQRGIAHEPMLFNLPFSMRLTEALADSLTKAGDWERAASELRDFLDRAEMLGAPDRWQVLGLYLKLGAAYRASGDVDGAVWAWKQGVRSDGFGYYYGNETVLSMAESLKVYSETFTDDSVSALGIEGDQFVPDSFVSSAMASVLGTFLVFVTWFFAGGVLLMPFWILVKVQKKPYDMPTLANAKRYLWADFLLFVCIPAAVGIGIGLVFRSSRPYLLFIPGGFALLGIIGALVDALLRAHRHNIETPRIICAVIGALWIPISIFLAATTVFYTGTFAFLLLMGPQW